MNNSLFIKKISINRLLVKQNWMQKKQAFLYTFSILVMCLSCEKPNTTQEPSFFDVQGENGFVGKLQGTNALVSILLGENEGIAYICNGEEDISEWFSGPISDTRQIHFTNRQGAEIKASLIKNIFEGEVVLHDNTTYSFTAKVNSGINGGIYRVIDEKAELAEIEASWIVNSNNEQRGSVTVQSRQLPNIILSQKNFDDINNGLSNKINIQGNSFSVFRYRVKDPISPVPPVPIPYPIRSN
ncbi:hypothetical protein [uncultured Maribacter sp.]|uniref:hypothetical protein n=1 Tax=uncultured Maribacter sp. TaxID=431308 RepID=UPI0030ED603F